MRFSIIALAFLFTILSIVRAEVAMSYPSTQLLTGDNIEEELTRRITFMRRADEENGHTKASGSQSENASSPTVSSGNDGDHATGSKKEKETHSSPANEPAAKKTTTTAKKNKNGSFNSPTILQGGTFFYIAVSVTTFLWITGKAIDIQMNRQERYAEKIANSI